MEIQHCMASWSQEELTRKTRKKSLKALITFHLHPHSHQRIMKEEKAVPYGELKSRKSWQVRKTTTKKSVKASQRASSHPPPPSHPLITKERKAMLQDELEPRRVGNRETGDEKERFRRRESKSLVSDVGAVVATTVRFSRSEWPNLRPPNDVTGLRGIACQTLQNWTRSSEPDVHFW